MCDGNDGDDDDDVHDATLERRFPTVRTEVPIYRMQLQLFHSFVRRASDTVPAKNKRSNVA